MTQRTPLKTALTGTWTIDEMAALKSATIAASRQALAAVPRPETIHIDLNDVTDIDACGCQLLAVFLENLKNWGISPVICGITAGIETKMKLAGFGALAGSPVAAKETA